MESPQTPEERDYALKARIVDGIFAFLNKLVAGGVILGIFYIVYLTLAEYAGKTTLADVAIKFVAELGIDRWIAYLVGGGGIYYGLRQRRLRHTSIERLSQRPIQLEEILDPDRESSGLTSRGTTNPGDK